MWYGGSNTTSITAGAVGLATSKDGVSWVKYSDNPVLQPSSSGLQYMASPYVISSGIAYQMWYTESSTTKSTSRILYATSYNRVTWTTRPSAVLEPSQDPNAWDSGVVYAPSVIFDGSDFELWYSAFGQNALAPKIGIATSPDGATWTRFATNPILGPDSPGSWDSAGVEQPSVVVGQSGLLLYYDGFSNTEGARIGLATGPQSIAVPELPAPAIDVLMGILVLGVLCFAQNRKHVLNA